MTLCNGEMAVKRAGTTANLGRRGRACPGDEGVFPVGQRDSPRLRLLASGRSMENLVRGAGRACFCFSLLGETLVYGGLLPAATARYARGVQARLVGRLSY